MRYVHGVTRPMLAVSAADDPMIPEASLHATVRQASDKVLFEISPGGGHVGFVSGQPWSPKFWAQLRVVEFLSSALPVMAL